MNEKLLSVKEAAKILDVHWQTVRNFIERGELNTHRIGKLIRITKADLEAFMQKDAPSEGKLEVEKRYLITSLEELHKRLIELGGMVAYQAGVVDHWFIPRNVKSRAEHDEWFDKKRGCGLRIREQNNGYTGKIITTLEAKRLTQAMNHNTFLEAETEVESYSKAKELLELMDLKEFLTIDKNRVMYKLEGFKISVDDIKGLGCGMEIEIQNATSREEALLQIDQMAAKLGYSKKDALEKSMTVLAMDKLADFS